MFALFVAVMYAGFPMTVLSQLTTGPMLDVIAPADRIGYVQGLNNAAMNFGMAIAPWLFGILADTTTTNIAIITGICISLIAALINSRLMCDTRFGKMKPLPPTSKRVLEGEDEDFVQSVLDGGSAVDQAKLLEINLERIKQGKSVLVPRIRTYEEDKNLGLDGLKGSATEVFERRMEIDDRILTAISDGEKHNHTVDEFCDMLNAGLYSDPQTMESAKNEIGQWVGDYLQDVGYNPHTASVVLKQLVLTAFPPIKMEEEFTPENLETALVNQRRVYGTYLDLHEKEEQEHWSLGTTLATAPPVFYS